VTKNHIVDTVVEIRTARQEIGRSLLLISSPTQNRMETGQNDNRGNHVGFVGVIFPIKASVPQKEKRVRHAEP
jgi:hypothetical protein